MPRPAVRHLPLAHSLNTLHLTLNSIVDEDGDHDWNVCWLKDDFNDTSPPEEPAEPEEPEEEPEAEGPAFGSDQLDQDKGCYGSGLNWADLHGSAGTDEQELVNDINTQCQMADGLTLGLNSFWRSCTEWAADDAEVNHVRIATVLETVFAVNTNARRRSGGRSRPKPSTPTSTP